MRGRIEGRCDCGALHYVCASEQQEVVPCGCLDCSRHNLVESTQVLRVSCHSMEIDGEETKFVADVAGHLINQVFCQRCGTKIHYQDSARPDDFFLSIEQIVSRQALN